MNQVVKVNNSLPEAQEIDEFELIEQVVMQGDLSKLNAQQKVQYYNKVCESVGLNPLTRPFDYINLNGKLTLYARKDCTEQLRQLKGVSIDKLESRIVDDLYIVTATARAKDGRIDQSTGAVVIGHLKGEARANAIMKAETKAKRRVTLSIAGMGFTDESEIVSIPGAEKVNVDFETGEINNEPSQIEFKPPVLTDEQAADLFMLIQKCDQSWISDKVLPFLRKESGKEDDTEALNNLPSRHYKKIKERLQNHIAEEKVKREEKQVSLVQEEEIDLMAQ